MSKSAFTLARQLRPARPTLFKFRYSPQYLPPYNLENFEREGHALAIRTRADFEARPRHGLWCFHQAQANYSQDKTVRNHARRKVLKAWREVLAEQGLNEDGRMTEESRAAAKQQEHNLPDFEDFPAPIDLSGTLYLMPLPRMTKAKYADVKGEVGKVLRYLMRHQWLHGTRPDDYREVESLRTRQKPQIEPPQQHDSATDLPTANKSRHAWEQFL